MTIFKALFAEGYRARREGRLADSRAIFLDAVRQAAEAADRPALGEALCGLGQAENDIGNCPASEHHYAAAVVLFRQIGPQERLAYALRHQADLLRRARHTADKEKHSEDQVRLTEAEPLLLEAETIYRQLGDPAHLDLANTLRILALVREASGDPSSARPLWSEARDLYASCNVEAGVAECTRRLAP